MLEDMRPLAGANVFRAVLPNHIIACYQSSTAIENDLIILLPSFLYLYPFLECIVFLNVTGLDFRGAPQRELANGEALQDRIRYGTQGKRLRIQNEVALHSTIGPLLEESGQIRATSA